MTMNDKRRLPHSREHIQKVARTKMLRLWAEACSPNTLDRSRFDGWVEVEFLRIRGVGRNMLHEIRQWMGEGGYELGRLSTTHRDAFVRKS